MPRWLRRLLWGPTDGDISARSQAAGGPPYPIQEHETRPPTMLRAADFSIDPDPPTIPWDRVVAESEATLLNIEHRRAATPGPMFDLPADEYPTLGQPGSYQRRMKEKAVNDPTDISLPDPRPTGTDAGRNLGESLRAAGIGTTRDSRDRIIMTATPVDPVTDSGIHQAAPDRRTISITCPTCEGLGHMQRTVSELLRESIALIPPDGGQQVIREFYRRLLTAAPDLAGLFPSDLITAAVDDTASPGRMQRDRLLQALAALAELYGTSPADRQRLDTALRSYGRSHAAFARPDGTTRGATVEEYLVVKQTLMDTLHTAAGPAWQAAYDDAWAEAYDYAMIVMLHEQFTGGMTFPRQARADLPTPHRA